MVLFFNPQIRLQGTSVLLTLSLSAMSLAAALSHKTSRRTRMSYGSLKLLPALIPNGGYSLPLPLSHTANIFFLT